MYDFLKRIMDMVGSLVGSILLLPIFLLVALAIKLDSQGPIFAETPMRVGRDGELFKMYKFRSMIANAHGLLTTDPRFKKLYDEYKKSSYKLTKDPRITRVGKFIRKYSLDELPQLINVLRGEMSLVGPRAYYPDELEEQQKNYPETKEYVNIILSGKPGITGIWQVSGRSGINFDERVKMDASYVQKRSIIYDFWLILKTIPAVISGKGAV
ncbi:MAG: sugar transferase [Candidatus Daviesbacteria bacterium]|nr:sugar transferase [Candidatus Daviesbacteria bacterium]